MHMVGLSEKHGVLLEYQNSVLKFYEKKLHISLTTRSSSFISQLRQFMSVFYLYTDTLTLYLLVKCFKTCHV